MSAELCVCGQPVASCEHLGVFATLIEKRAWYLDIEQAHLELALLSAKADAKRALAIANIAATRVSMLPEGSPLGPVLELIKAAIAKATALLEV